MSKENKKKEHWSSNNPYEVFYRRKSWEASRRVAIFALILSIVSLIMSVIHLLEVIR